MARTGNFTPTKQSNRYTSCKSTPEAERCIMSPRAQKAPSTTNVASPAESTHLALHSWLMKVPSHARWMVINHLCIMAMMEESVVKVEQEKVKQWAWLQQWEANKDREIIWGEREVGAPDKQVQASCDSSTVAEPVEKQGKLDCENMFKTATCGAALGMAPFVINVTALWAEDMVQGIEHNKEADSSSSEAVVEGLGGASSSDSDNKVVSALMSLVLGLQETAYNIFMCTLFTSALLDIALTSVVTSNAAAVAVDSCRRLSDSLTGAVKTLVSPRSSIDAM